MTLRVRYDDGFVAYLNGTQIARANASSSPPWDQGAAASHDDISATFFEEFNCSAFVDRLQSGENLLAIHGMNAGATSSDFLVSVELIAGEDTNAGLLSPSARPYTEGVALDGSVQIQARVWENGQWSELNEAVYTVGLP